MILDGKNSVTNTKKHSKGAVVSKEKENSTFSGIVKGHKQGISADEVYFKTDQNKNCVLGSNQSIVG